MSQRSTARRCSAYAVSRRRLPAPRKSPCAWTSSWGMIWSMGDAIRHVLFDADGVLQDLPGGWYAAMEPYLGSRARDFLHETWSDELPMLAGRGDYLPVLAASLEKYGVSTPATEVYDAVWKNIVLIEESLDIVRTLKRNGYGVHLGTNQECYRGAHMREALGYDDLF